MYLNSVLCNYLYLMNATVTILVTMMEIVFVTNIKITMI